MENYSDNPRGVVKKKLSRLLSRIDVMSFNAMMSLKVATDRVSSGSAVLLPPDWN